jgi:hypothetical protein
VALDEYVSGEASVRLPLLVGVRVIDPAAVGVMVNVCGVAEFEKVNIVGERPKPPVGVKVIVPVYGPFGVTVKLVDALPTLPLDGPTNV